MDSAERGFSFAQDGPLDMRMSPAALQSAEDIVNTWSEAELGCIFREYGEERAWRGIARRLVEVCGVPVAHSGNVGADPCLALPTACAHVPCKHASHLP